MTAPLFIDDLPEFDHPPVVETVLSVQFEPVEGMKTVHYGLFWERIRQQFPVTECKPALEPVIERFDDPPKRATHLRFESRGDTPPIRIWFTNETGTEMIQLQNDRFIKNWRKATDEDVYPRYEMVIKPGFQRDFQSFREWLATASLGPTRINQCELTYVNHIVADQGSRTWAETTAIFSFLGGLPENVEDGSFFLRFPIHYEQRQVGRLFVEIQPGVRASDSTPIYVMNLTARGFIGAGFEFFDLGRAAIVSSFARLTTPAMHKIWGRTK